jgi:glycine dehydrogenase
MRPGQQPEKDCPVTPAPLCPADLHPCDTFVRRHLGATAQDEALMLEAVGARSLAELVSQTVPQNIAIARPLHLQGLPTDRSLGEQELLSRLRTLAKKNRPMRSYLGMGYADTLTPPVIQRNILENPGWYTQYTPYQAEIAQGRLEALLNFQTLVTDLCALPMANASLLDEGTAAAEAMAMAYAISKSARPLFYASDACHPQTLAVLQTRAAALNIVLCIGPLEDIPHESADLFGVLVQYPDTHGKIVDHQGLADALHKNSALLIVATDLLSLTVLRPPGEFGADIAVGTAQRFGVPLGYGGPHAAFLVTSEAYKRVMPGRVIGLSRDARGKPALRMAMQTREQHIRREKATSNICTAQALLAIMASMYAVYHGPKGLRAIAERIGKLTALLATGLRSLGYQVSEAAHFDTLVVSRRGSGTGCSAIMQAAVQAGINLRPIDADSVGIALDEVTTVADIEALWQVFKTAAPTPQSTPILAEMLAASHLPELGVHARKTPILLHPLFNSYHSEHEMLRYINRLRSRDLSLTHGMIPLGSCTMKLNATVEMLPVSWPEFNRVHPFAPPEQNAGYTELFADLTQWLSEITGFAAVSLQPNAGAQGEYAGLMVIRAYHHSRNQPQRKVCLIPVSAHGTNPASATMAGFKVVPIACDAAGNVDLQDLKQKATEHQDTLAALMVTYPSTHGVFEEGIVDICKIVHAHGGQVYLDGANMNAQVALCRPGDFGADVCHLNLHKTFCIPHGGGGPGMGPIGVAAHLKDFLPRHPLIETGGPQGIGPVASAPFGSASILPISWVYIALMGAQGLQHATSLAILNANYMATRLKDHYPILYRGSHGRVAHEFILDTRAFKQSAGIEAEDIAKRLMDYGLHAPTMSFPVANTLMIEPTESESKAELDKFCDAMVGIRKEIAAIETAQAPRQDNVLKNAPHTADMVMANDWTHPYTREQAAFPLASLRQTKFWPAVARIDNAYGDRNLICTCPPVGDYF